MDKYQEALMNLDMFCTNHVKGRMNGFRFPRDIATLQELVDKEIARKDLEEQLSCPLEALLSKSAMVEIDGVIYEVNIMAVSFTNGNIYFGSEWNFTTRKIKDYGKIWWLKGDKE